LIIIYDICSIYIEEKSKKYYLLSHKYEVILGRNAQMITHLQKQIKARIEAKNLSINALEKKAGLKRSAARNIIQGLSKKPSAEVLKSLAQVLECTVDDLLGENRSNMPNSHKITAPSGQTPFNEKLFSESVKIVTKLFQAKGQEFTLEQVMYYAAETYKYSLTKESDKVDKDFAKWLVERGS
jgi:transcriptional regulator with XRE-family HTH domain